jgi:hypothetical protein
VKRWKLGAALVLAVVLGTAARSGATHLGCPDIPDQNSAVTLRQSGLDQVEAATRKARKARGSRALYGKAIRERAKRVVALWRDNPDMVDGTTLDPVGLRSGASLSDQNCIEHDVIIDGQVVTSIATSPDGVSATQYAVVDPSTNQSYPLHIPTAYASRLEPGQRHHVKGYRIAHDILVTDLAPLAEATSGAAGAFATITWPTTGTLRDLIVLVAHPDSANTTTFNEASINRDTKERYIHTVSYQKATLISDIYPTIVNSPSPAACDPVAEFNQIIPLIDANVDFRQYRTVSFVSGYQSCFWGGIGIIGEDFNVTTQDGRLPMGVNQSREHRVGTELHEFGHDIGVHHGAELLADTWFPAGLTGAVGVSWWEYLTNWTLMGQSSFLGSFGPLQRWYLGWLTDGVDFLQNPPPGRYRILPVGAAVGTPGIRGIAFRRGLVDFLVLEHRAQTDEFELSGAASKPFGYLQIISSGGTIWPHEGHHRLTSRTQQGALPGDVITDVTGTQINVVSVSAQEAVVDVIAVGAPDLVPPQLALISPSAGSQVSGQSLASAYFSDDHPYSVTFSVQPATGQRLALGGPITAGPYELLFDSTTIPNGTARFYARGCDVVGQCVESSALALVSNDGGGGTTTTTLPSDDLIPILEVHEPNPSSLGEVVTFTISGVRNGVPVDMLLGLQVNLGDGTGCQQDLGTPNGPRLTCHKAYTQPNSCFPCIGSIYIRDAGGWTRTPTAFQHYVLATPPTTSSTLVPPTSTTRPPTTSTVLPTTTTAVPTTTTRAPTTSTSSSTSSTRPSTTTSSLVCRPRAVVCALNSECCSGKCRGGRNKKCQ